MTTRSTKPVSRLVEAAIVRDAGKTRPLVVTIDPHGFLELRQKGRRARETLLLSDCYFIAVRQRVNKAKAERSARRAR